MAEYLARAVKRRLKVSKLDCLLFDGISVMDAQAQLDQLHKTDAALAADYEYLASEGVLEEAPATNYEIGRAILYGLEERGWEQYVTPHEHDLLGVPARQPCWGERDRPARVRVGEETLLCGDPLVELASTAVHPSRSYLSRYGPLPEGGELIASWAERLHGLPSVAVLERQLSDPDWSQLEQFFATKYLRRLVGDEGPKDAAVLELVIGRLPVVADEVPLEDVLAFSRDAETRERATALRLWIAKAAMTDTPLPELSLELDEMLHNFRRHMRAYDIKAKDSILRTLIILPLAIIEDLLHGKPKSAFESASWKSRKAARLEAELAAPGHETAFLETISRHFG